MPWTMKDAIKHTKKATSAKLKRQWAEVANSALQQGASEEKAIIEANGVIKKMAEKSPAPSARASDSEATVH